MSKIYVIQSVATCVGSTLWGPYGTEEKAYEACRRLIEDYNDWHTPPLVPPYKVVAIPLDELDTFDGSDQSYPKQL